MSGDPNVSSSHILNIDPNEIKLESQVGQGAYGIVFKGMWNELPVAIKKLTCGNSNPQIIDKMQQEVTVAAQLRHPHIVHMYGTCKISDSELWIIMELADCNLTNYLADPSKIITWKQRWEWATQAASALSYLHSKGIVHRDIKSPNFLLKNNQLKLTDFGLSADATTSIRTNTFANEVTFGTPRWTAPETVAKKPIANEKSDVYSLGLVFWELAARKLPFHEQPNDMCIITIVKYEKARPDIPEDCSPLFSTIIEKCWDHEPEDRPSSQQVLTYLDKNFLEFRQMLCEDDNHHRFRYKPVKGISPTTTFAADGNFDKSSTLTGFHIPGARPLIRNRTFSVANGRSASAQLPLHEPTRGKTTLRIPSQIITQDDFGRTIIVPSQIDIPSRLPESHRIKR